MSVCHDWVADEMNDSNLAIIVWILLEA